jgi:hypothetical protein
VNRTEIFVLGYALGVVTGPLAVFLIAFYFAQRDRRSSR